ncbi:hypothetical protein GCM10027294_23690 [Marinactinospora endophytica]
MRPALPLPPVDEGTRVPGMLLIRTDHDDDAWRDVLHRMGELPGLVTPRPGDDAHAPAQEEGGIPRRLVVVDDPAWRGATPEEVNEALGRDGTWVPDLVLMATERTAATPHLRPLRAFRSDGDVYLFRITPRQAALAYLVMHHNLDTTFEYFEEWSPLPPEWEPEEGEDLDEWEAGLPDPVGAYLERLDPLPRYTPSTPALPLLTQDDHTDLIVRTDFSDDAAWHTLLDTVYRPGDRGPIHDFGDYIDVVDDPVFDGATPEQVMAVLREWGEAVVIADGAAMRDSGHHVLVVPWRPASGAPSGWPPTWSGPCWSTCRSATRMSRTTWTARPREPSIRSGRGDRSAPEGHHPAGEPALWGRHCAAGEVGVGQVASLEDVSGEAEIPVTGEAAVAGALLAGEVLVRHGPEPVGQILSRFSPPPLPTVRARHADSRRRLAVSPP